MSNGGILGQMFLPESTVRKRAIEDLKHTLFDAIGPEALDDLSEEQYDRLLAASLRIAPDHVDYVTEYLVDEVRGDSRREATRKAQRECIWAIENELAGRFPEELTAEIQRARAGPQVLSAATHEQYAADQKHFAEFCRSQGVASMPAEPAVLAKYLLDECAPSVVGRRLAALADSHKRGGRILPRKHPLVRVAIQQAKAAATQPPAAPSSGAGEEEKPNG